MNPNTFIDVHTYDTKLTNIFSLEKNYSIDDKTILFNELEQKLTDPFAINTLKTIRNDMRHVNGGANFQPENNLDASDILADILEVKDDDILPLLQEQLSDITKLGLCNSGRCTRLLQIWRAIKNK